MAKKSITALVLIGLLLLALLGIFHWSVNRYYVPEGKSLLLRYKGPLLLGRGTPAKQGHWAEEGQVGVLANLRGPGRHFYCPVWWDRSLVDDIIIKPGEVGVVTCKLGDPLPNGEFLVDGEIGQTLSKGVLRKVLGPGRYRINPYGYQVDVVKTQSNKLGTTEKSSGWVSIATGFVGVVTNLANNPLTKQTAGIQDKVLPPGLYPINPREQQIDIVKVGYWETSINMESDKPFAELVKADETGGNVDGQLRGGINFPSSDGFGIIMDYTAIWGLMPDQAPNAIKKFGNVKLIEQKVILPQMESISRNNGSEYTATQLLVGAEREIFQNDTLSELEKALADKEISLLYGSVRHIYIPRDVRQPIQTAFISDELKLTREAEQLTAVQEGILREAEQKVVLESKRVEVDTTKQIAEKLAEGDKEAAEARAEGRKLVAAIERQTAELESDAKTVLGQAENSGKQLLEEAKAGKFKLAVAAFGTPSAYNNWTFASNLPENLDLKFLYAGPGTMWTDIKEAVRIMAPPPSEPKKPTDK